MTWVLVFLGFISLIILHEAGHFVAAKATGMRVERFFLFFPPKLVSKKIGETEYGVGWIPAGGFVKITGMNPEEELPPEIAARGYYHQPVWKRIVVIGAGPAVNIVLCFAILFALGFSLQEPTAVVGPREAGFPADKVLRSGDKIISVDGHAFADRSVDGRLLGWSALIASHRCAGQQTKGCKAKTPVKLVIERDGAERTLSVTPVYDPASGKARIGFGYRGNYESQSAGTAANFAVDRMWEVTSGTVSTFAQIFKPEKREQLSGVVGVSDVAHQTIDVGWRESLFLLAIVSLSLGLINLFPFLPLDGGHIFWSLVEKARGRPVSFQTMERAGVVGFVLVIAIAMIGLTNDIGRITGDGFNVR